MIEGKSGLISVRTKALNLYQKNVLILVQGANISGQLGFDFSFPGGKGYSFMDAMTERHIGTVTFSIRGYAKSELNEDPLSVQTDQAIEDLETIISWLTTKNINYPNLLGWSWGGRIVGRYAENKPDKIGSLILLDPALGGGQLIPPKPTEGWWKNTYNYYFNRLENEFTETEARKALASLVEKEEPESPNGIRQENAIGSIPVKPEAITSPTLLVYGSSAGAQNYMKGSMPRGEFFEKLNSEDKSLIVISGGGDYAHLQNPREKIHKSTADFIIDNNC